MNILEKFLFNFGYVKTNRIFRAMDTFEKQPISKFTDYNSYLNAIKTVSWVNKCVSIIAESIGMAKGYVLDNNNKEVTDKDLINLLNRPNPFMSWFEFKEGLVYYILLTGNCYIAKEEINGNGQPKELYLIRPDRMKVVPSTNYISGYSYEINAKKITFEIEEISHLKLFNPLDDRYGLGKIEVAELTYNIEYKSAVYNHKFFENGARPSGILSTEQKIDDDTFKRMKEQWNTENQGYKKMHKTAVLEQGLKYTQLSLTQKDMDFISQRKLTREEILSIFGVPPAKAGILEHANYSNAKEQNYTYQRETITPLLKRIQDKLTIDLIQKFNPNWRYEFESVIERDEREWSEIAQRYWNMSAITPNEIRTEFLGLEPINDDAMDQVYIGINLIPISESGNIPQLPEPTKSVTGEKAKPNVRQLIYRESVITRRRIGKTAKKIMVKFFNEQEKRIIEAVKSKGLEIIDTKGLENIFNLGFEDEMLIGTSKKFHTSMMMVTIDILNDIFNLDTDNSTQNPEVTHGLQRLARKVTDVNKTTKDKIEEIIKIGRENGYTIDEIVSGIPEKEFKGIKDVFEGATKYRAEMIARTETARAWDQGAYVDYKTYGITRVDVIGCEGDPSTGEPESSNCNRQNIPIEEVPGLEFHPQHVGVIVPRI